MPSPSDQVDQIERDRKRREAELLLALIVLSTDARRFITAGIRDGHGIPDLTMRKLAPIILDSMADAHVAGLRRAGALAGVELIPRGVATEDLPEYEAAARLYVPAARAKAEEIRRALAGLATAAVTEAMRTGTSPTRAVAASWTRWGWTKGDPASVDPGATGKPGWSVAGHATDAVLAGYNGGIFAGYNAGPVAERLTALEHRSVVDRRTSDICRDRHRLVLPASDPYWLTNWVSLHRRCRSVIVPHFRPIAYSDWRPTVPPEPGFGAAPALAFGVRFGEAA
jgi:hypothetical protein